SNGAILHDVDAALVGGAGEAPGDGVVPRRAGATLHHAAEDRIAHRSIAIEDRDLGQYLIARQQLGIDAVEAERGETAADLAHLMAAVRERYEPALREHHIVVELLGEPFPQLQRMLVEMRAVVPEIVGAHDRSIAPGIAAAEPALLDHRDVGNAVILGKVIGGGEPMPAAADENHLIGGSGCGIAPGRRPAAMALDRLAEEAQKRIAHARCRPPSGGNGSAASSLWVDAPLCLHAASPSARRQESER